MPELITLKNNTALVSTKDIADKFGKIHRDVMRAVKNLDCSDDFRSRNYAQSSYVTTQGKKLKCIDMTRDGFVYLCMGFSGSEAAKWKEAYINAFNKMESMLRGDGSVMQALNNAMSLMEKDKEIASACGRGLGVWKEQRRIHIEKVERLYSDVQMLLNFDGRKAADNGKS